MVQGKRELAEQNARKQRDQHQADETGDDLDGKVSHGNDNPLNVPTFMLFSIGGYAWPCSQFKRLVQFGQLRLETETLADFGLQP